jgi:hypothetical protein
MTELFGDGELRKMRRGCALVGGRTMTGTEHLGRSPRWLRMHMLVLVAAGCAVDVDTTDTAQEVAHIEGELEVFVISDRPRQAPLHELVDDRGRRVTLEFERAAPRLATGDRVRVEGSRLDDARFAVRDAVARSARLAVLMVHWSQPSDLTVEQMRERVFTGERSTSAFYKENSYGLFELTGEVYGWYQISPISGCDTQTLASRARAAAVADGVDIESFDQILYFYPRTQSCGFSGLAQLGRPTRPARDTWYNGSSGCVVLAQELLHNWGAVHSRSYSCGAEVIGAASGCQDSEYGDPYDPMGGGCYHTNVYQKAAQGWFGRCNVVTTTSDETFKIAPAERPTNVVQALRAPMDASLCPAELSSCFYYLEYRQPLGPFDGAQEDSPVHDGVLVHVAPTVDFSGAGRPGSPFLLDHTPNSSMREDFADAVLEPGMVFEDPAGTSISVDALEPDGATVTVRFPNGGSGPPTCIDGTGVSVGPPPAQGSCDEGEFEFESHCYTATDMADDYDAAAALCAARGAGWGLAEIGSAAETAFVVRVAGTGEFWLGGSDRASEGTWVWSSGTQFWTGGATGAPVAGVYTNFEPGEPNDNGGNSDCLRMIAGGAWRDIDCAQEFPAICESE